MVTSEICILEDGWFVKFVSTARHAEAHWTDGPFASRTEAALFRKRRYAEMKKAGVQIAPLRLNTD